MIAGSEKPMSDVPQWTGLFGQQVVLDLRSSFLCVGRLVERQGDFLLLADADMHDLRETTTTREQYLLKCREGMPPNRQFVWIPIGELVGLSRLADVIVP